MAFGDALLGIQEQLVPSELDNALSGAPVRALPARQLDIPTQLAEPNFTLTPDNSKRLKGIGKFLNSAADVLADPATQKALATIGIGLDPRGVGGALGGLGVSLAEENARDEFRAAIAAGGDPSQIQVSGLSSEGRQAVLGEVNEGSELQRRSGLEERALALRESDSQFDQEVELLKSQLDERRLELQEGNLEARQDELDISRQARFDNLEIQKTKVQLDRIRTNIQNQVDLARIEATQQESEARTDRANTDALIKINQQRGKQVEALTEVEAELQGKLRSAQQQFDEVKSKRGRFFGGSSDEEFTSAAQTVAQLESQMAEAQGLRESLLQDISSDLAAESERIQGSLPGAESQASTPRQTPTETNVGEIPVVRSVSDLSKVKEGDRFFMPDPQTKRPILVQMQNGVPRRVIR